MARPPQYSYGDDDLVSAEAVRAMLKHLDEPGRAFILAWLCTYFQDSGAMFSPQIGKRRDRITLNGIEFWLVRVPKRPRLHGFRRVP